MMDSACDGPVQIPGLKHAVGIGAGVNGIWVADESTSTLFAIRPPNFACQGAQVLGKVATSGLSKPRAIIWGMNSGTSVVANCGNNSVAVFDASSSDKPTQLFGSPFTGGGLDGPVGVLIDGDANAWVANNAPGANSISEIGHMTKMFANTGMALSPATGFDGPGLDRPYGIAIDHRGNVWITNQGDDSVTVFFGVVVPPSF